eukprot:5864430-Amphidinium_carterae.1
MQSEKRSGTRTDVKHRFHVHMTDTDKVTNPFPANSSCVRRVGHASLCIDLHNGAGRPIRHSSQVAGGNLHCNKSRHPRNVHTS